MPLGKFEQFREIAAGRHVGAGVSTSVNGHDEQADRLKVAILILSLYNDNFFDVPEVLVADPGWRIDWIKRERRTAEPRYQVMKEEWPRFQKFLAMAEYAICQIPGLDSWPRFSVAAERYLRATFATGHSFFSDLSPDGYTFDEVTGEEVIVEGKRSEDRFLKEDVLFNYVIGLEVLVLKKNDPALEKQQLLSERVAALVARGEKEEKLVRKFLVSAYCARNNLVHQSKEPRLNPRLLRRIFQRALGMAITLGAATKNRSELEKLIICDKDPKKLLSRRERVDQAREELISLIADSSELDKWKSPVQHWRYSL